MGLEEVGAPLALRGALKQLRSCAKPLRADALARAAAQQNLGTEFAVRLSRTLTALDDGFTETGETPRDVLFSRAQRLVLALERLSDFANRTRVNFPRPPELVELRQDLQWPGKFDTERFAARLRNYRLSLVSSAR